MISDAFDLLIAPSAVSEPPVAAFNRNRGVLLMRPFSSWWLR